MAQFPFHFYTSLLPLSQRLYNQCVPSRRTCLFALLIVTVSLGTFTFFGHDLDIQTQIQSQILPSSTESLILSSTESPTLSSTESSTSTSTSTESSTSTSTESPTPSPTQDVQPDKHEKFLILDWRYDLGWNNIRYIIEHHLFYAQMLGRTLVVPATVHMRKCFDEPMCEAHGVRIIDISTGNSITDNRWAMPIEHFLDFPRLKSKTKVVTMIEFLRGQATLAGYSADAIEKLIDPSSIAAHVLDGTRHHETFPKQTYIKANVYNFLHERPTGCIAVDDLRPVYASSGPGVSMSNVTLYAHVDYPHFAVDTGYEFNVLVVAGNETLSAELKPYVNTPRRPASVEFRSWEEDRNAPPGTVATLRGFYETWTAPTYADPTFFHFEGTTHRWGWQPLKFTTAAGREMYRTIAIDWMHYAPPVIEVADYAWKKLMQETGGRPYIAYHLRRGDFGPLGWNNGLSDSEVSVRLINKSLVDLHALFKINLANGRASGQLASRHFLATDDSTPAGLKPLYESGAIRLKDLLAKNSSDPSSNEFWDKYGELVSFGDWLGLVEQTICARSWFFVGTDYSSFSGGVFNMRRGLGKEVSETGFVGHWV